MDFTEILKQFNIVDASLYGVALIIAIILRFVRAYVDHFGNTQTIGLAAVFSILGAILTLTMTPHPWQFIALQCIGLLAAVLIVEFTLRKLGDKVSWIPADNQYVTPKEEPKP